MCPPRPSAAASIYSNCSVSSLCYSSSDRFENQSKAFGMLLLWLTCRCCGCCCVLCGCGVVYSIMVFVTANCDISFISIDVDVILDILFVFA